MVPSADPIMPDDTAPPLPAILQTIKTVLLSLQLLDEKCFQTLVVDQKYLDEQCLKLVSCKYFTILSPFIDNKNVNGQIVRMFRLDNQ